MRYGIFLLAVFVLSLFLAGCGKDVNPASISEDEYLSCGKDSDCVHVKGCHEDGGSACVNKKYAKVLGQPNENCDENDCMACSTCVCEQGRCKNKLDTQTWCC